jgi:hypothetical protein
MPKPTPPQTMPTTKMVVVNPQPPYPRAAMTDHKSPPPAVREINPVDAEFGAHALEMDASPSCVGPDLLLGDQTRNSHRRKIVNEKGRARHPGKLIGKNKPWLDILSYVVAVLIVFEDREPGADAGEDPSKPGGGGVKRVPAIAVRRPSPAKCVSAAAARPSSSGNDRPIARHRLSEDAWAGGCLRAV